MGSRAITLIGFAVIVGAAIVWEIVATLHPRWVTVGQVQRWLMRSFAFRVFLFGLWAWLGLHLFARGSG
jgi:hypothetical protein